MWGAFGAVNPASGLVANSRGVGEEEQLECLQPSQPRCACTAPLDLLALHRNLSPPFAETQANIAAFL